MKRGWGRHMTPNWPSHAHTCTHPYKHSLTDTHAHTHATYIHAYQERKKGRKGGREGDRDRSGWGDCEHQYSLFFASCPWIQQSQLPHLPAAIIPHHGTKASNRESTETLFSLNCFCNFQFAISGQEKAGRLFEIEKKVGHEHKRCDESHMLWRSKQRQMDRPRGVREAPGIRAVPPWTQPGANMLVIPALRSRDGRIRGSTPELHETLSQKKIERKNQNRTQWGELCPITENPRENTYQPFDRGSRHTRSQSLKVFAVLGQHYSFFSSEENHFHVVKDGCLPWWISCSMYNDLAAPIHFFCRDCILLKPVTLSICPRQVSETAGGFISLTYLVQMEEKWATKPHQLEGGKGTRSSSVTEIWNFFL